MFLKIKKMNEKEFKFFTGDLFVAWLAYWLERCFTVVIEKEMCKPSSLPISSSYLEREQTISFIWRKKKRRK